MFKKEMFKKSALALTIGGLLLMSGPGFAQTAREAALEARIAELERLVGELARQQQAAAPAPAAPAAPALPAGVQPIQTTSVVPGANPGTRFSFGGFIKANSSWSDYSDGNPAAGTVARDFYLPGAIPVGGAGESAVFDAHAKQSRFWFATDTVLDNGSKLGSRIELDFAVPTGGDERSTNTYNPVLRRAYFTYDKWLFGQEWSNFMELGALPETTDFIGATEGTVFVRQPQIRYTSGAWSVSVENPETVLTPFGGGAKIITDDNTVPDFTARYANRGDWGVFSVAGIVRQLRSETAAGGETATGYGVSVSSKLMFGANDLRLMATAGSGIGRYVGVNFFDDAVIEADGSLDPIDVVAAYAAWRQVWGGTWRSNFIVGYTSADNERALTGLNANAEATSFRANLFWSPAPKIDMGIELSTAKRELERGTSGTQNRVDFMARYTF
ncbi:DcaP family trimeric outer membrane transporter [Aquimonas sp.]|uniref:DcaP family trimeric outer membrane transporter n=1 Tax=Aquimonas sp. TaxID=1872588 RepID=UPI0037C0C789